MPLTLDATVGGTQSNAYLDLSSAQAIIDLTPNTDKWDGAGAMLRESALAAATAMLDVMAYQGTKVSASQALQWPRWNVLDPDYGDCDGSSTYETIDNFGYVGTYLDSTTIPKRIQRACVMLALEILRAGTSDVWGVDTSLDVSMKKVDVLETQYVDPVRRQTGLRRYPSVWRELLPLLHATTSGSVVRA